MEQTREQLTKVAKEVKTRRKKIRMPATKKKQAKSKRLHWRGGCCRFEMEADSRASSSLLVLITTLFLRIKSKSITDQR